jgi:hypothetical protein
VVHDAILPSASLSRNAERCSSGAMCRFRYPLGKADGDEGATILEIRLKIAPA